MDIDYENYSRMLSDPNKLWERGECMVCGHETTITEGNFTVIFSNRGS